MSPTEPDRVFFVPHVADPDAPTRAELEGGVELTGFIADDGLRFGPATRRKTGPTLDEAVAAFVRGPTITKLAPRRHDGHPVIDGEVVDPAKPRRPSPPLMICDGRDMVLVTDPASYFGWGKRDGQADG